MDFLNKARSCRWSWTLFNYTEEMIEGVATAFKTNEKLSYIVWGREVCPDTGRKHLQGYLEMKIKSGFRTVLKHAGLPQNTFICVSKGNAKENRAYCTKDGNQVVELGKARDGQGHRNDLSDVKEMVKQGCSLEEIADVATSYQGLRSINTYRAIYDKPRDFETKVVWLWGDTGTGKTLFARLITDNAWISAANGIEWFDGYYNNAYAILDDIRAESGRIEKFLRLFDRTGCPVPIKGSTVQWKPRLIVVTGPFHPQVLFRKGAPCFEENVQQLLRRCDYVIHADKWNTDVLVDIMREKEIAESESSDECPFVWDPLSVEEIYEMMDISIDDKSIERPKLALSKLSSPNVDGTRKTHYLASRSRKTSNVSGCTSASSFVCNSAKPFSFEKWPKVGGNIPRASPLGRSPPETDPRPGFGKEEMEESNAVLGSALARAAERLSH